MAEKNEKDASSISQRLAERVIEKADWLKYVVVAVLVVAVVAIGAISLIRSSNKEKRAASSAALYKAKIDAYGSLESDPQAVFGKVAKDFSGLPAGGQALLYQFSYASNRSDWDAAEKIAREFVKTYPSDAFAPSMRLALGQLLLSGGKLAEAKLELEAAAKVGGATRPEALLALAQIKEREAEAVKSDKAAYEQKLVEAREAYADIVSQAKSPVPQSYWPQQLVLTADFSLLLINERLSGYEHAAPRLPDTAAPAAGGNVGVVAAPPAESADAASQPAAAEPAEPAEQPKAAEAPAAGDEKAGE